MRICTAVLILAGLLALFLVPASSSATGGTCSRWNLPCTNDPDCVADGTNCGTYAAGTNCQEICTAEHCNRVCLQQSSYMNVVTFCRKLYCVTMVAHCESLGGTVTECKKQADDAVTGCSEQAYATAEWNCMSSGWQSEDCMDGC